jgi:hypothetical protein
MLLSEAERFSDLTIQGLPFTLDEFDRNRLMAAADALDAVRPPTGRKRWESYAHEGPPESLSGGSAILFQTEVTLFNEGSDWLELSLDVAFYAVPSLIVTASVEVACWCEPDHNIHFAEQHQWLVGSAGPLADAFEAGTAALHGWIVDGPREPEPRRVRAGLPGPKGGGGGI